jgi:magnesium transporter
MAGMDRGWGWTRVDSVTNEEFKQNLSEKFKQHHWFLDHGAQSDHFTLSDEDKAGNVTFIGSLPITITKRLETDDIHFILKKEKLITAGLSPSIFEWFHDQEFEYRTAQCKSPIDGFLFIINEILDRYIIDLYPSFKHIKLMHRKIEEDKTTEHLSQLIDYRHKLIRWENILIPYEEFLLTLRAALGENITNTLEYEKVHARVQKIFKLIQHYNGTINKLMSLDDTLVEYRGNEIMKTLTVFTVITAPITALGALWGMNFKYMPELNEKYGYPLALSIILISSAVIFFWLHKKGWTRNILKGKKDRDRKN